MKYKIGDVVSYKILGDKETGEIIDIKYENNKVLYILRLQFTDIKISIKENEIKKLIYSNKTKLKKFHKQLQNIGKNGFLVNSSGIIQLIKIIDFDFRTYNYIIERSTRRFILNPKCNKIFLDKLKAYEYAYNILLRKINKIKEII